MARWGVHRWSSSCPLQTSRLAPSLQHSDQPPKPTQTVVRVTFQLVTHGALEGAAPGHRAAQFNTPSKYTAKVWSARLHRMVPPGAARIPPKKPKRNQPRPPRARVPRLCVTPLKFAILSQFIVHSIKTLSPWVAVRNSSRGARTDRREHWPGALSRVRLHTWCNLLLE